MRTRPRATLSLILSALLVAALTVVPAQAHHKDDHTDSRDNANPNAKFHREPGDDPPDDDPVDPTLEPLDYISIAHTLSQPEYEILDEPEVVTVEAHDEAQLYLEITRPDPAVHGDGPWPVILEASPYHGTIATRIGDRMFPDPEDEDGLPLGLTGYFAPRGYAVVMFDLRGTGRSQGCLDHLGPNDADDLKTVIEWLAVQDWSNGKVGMTGHSYVGSTPSVAAAQAPDGLATIIPSAGLASMYDHQFQKGVPWLLQWVGPQVAYPSLATERDLPPGGPGIPVIGGGNTGDNWENAPNPEFGCGWQNSAAISGTGQVTGQYQEWHAARDWGEDAAGAEIPIFMIHGVHDNAARIPAAEWFFDGRYERPGDKVWIGQWDHGSTNGRCGSPANTRVLHPTCRFDQMKYAIHAWFDYHLMGMDVDTGPPVEAFLNGEQPLNLTQVRDPETWGTQVFTEDLWRQSDVQLGLYPDATSGRLLFEPPEDEGSDSYLAVSGFTPLVALPTIRPDEGLFFESDPLENDTVILGLPDMQLNASLSNAQVAHLSVTLYRSDGERLEDINHCAIQPSLRDGIEQFSPVVPGEEMALSLQCFTMATWVPAGQSLVMQVSSGTRHHATFNHDVQVTVFTGPDKTAYHLPVKPDAVLYDDVPLREPSEDPDDEPTPPGPAQPPIQGEVQVLASGFGFREDGVTSAMFEFDVEEAFDNASLQVVATPALPADIDLYLQQQSEDGSWSGDLASAETGNLAQETLGYDTPAAGRYRVEVHNWSGPPTSIDLAITFFNQEGVAGGEEDPPAIEAATARGTVAPAFELFMVP